MLTMLDAQTRDEPFRLVVDLARGAPEVDLTPLVPILLDVYEQSPDEQYRLAAVSALHAIGSEQAMQQVRRRFDREPSLIVQYVSGCALIDLYGPKAFGRDKEALSLARNVLARKHEAQRLAHRRYQQMMPRVTVGPLEVVHPDSLQ